jgi:hypothetical protein
VKLAPAERHITAEVLHISSDAASARVFTAQFNDYLHLVRRNGQWQILNVLWRPPTPSEPTPDGARTAVEQAVREYVRALFAADAARAVGLTHPVANLRSFNPGPQGRPRVIREQNPETLSAALASGQMKLPGSADDVQVTVEGVDVNIAAAHLAIGPGISYLHLAHTDGKWRIVNALTFQPARPGATNSGS